MDNKTAHIDPRDQLIGYINHLLSLDPADVRNELIRTKRSIMHELSATRVRHEVGILSIMSEEEKDKIRGLPAWTTYADGLRKALAAVEAML